MITTDNAAIWSAYGVLATALIYVVIGAVAYWQVRESRKARHVHIRPIVIVEPSFQGSLVHYAVRNVGATPAYNVAIEPTTSITPTNGFDTGWRDMALFSQSGMPMLGPGQEVRYLLGDFVALDNAGEGIRMSGRLSYRSIDGETYREQYDADLAMYRNARVEPAGIPDIVKQLKQINKTLVNLERLGKKVDRRFEPEHIAEIHLGSEPEAPAGSAPELMDG